MRQSSPGFTLLEVLVVVAIIAVLGGISTTIFLGAQSSSKDGQRRSEISSLAKSIEAAKDYASSPPKYTYNTDTAGKDFPKGIPYSGPKGASSEPYCIRTNTLTAESPVEMTINTPGAACSNNYKTLQESISSTTSGDMGAGDVIAWTLCARMERADSPYCISSLTAKAPTPTNTTAPPPPTSTPTPTVLPPPPTATPTPSPTPSGPPGFSGLSANLWGNQSSFTFTYSGGSSPTYFVDISTDPNLLSDVSTDFGSGNNSPISVTDPQNKWSSYACSKTVYWRVSNYNKGVRSSIQTSLITCSGAACPVFKNMVSGQSQTCIVPQDTLPSPLYVACSNIGVSGVYGLSTIDCPNAPAGSCVPLGNIGFSMSSTGPVLGNSLLESNDCSGQPGRATRKIILK